jgi:hypothetical protein
MKFRLLAVVLFLTLEFAGPVRLRRRRDSPLNLTRS